MTEFIVPSGPFRLRESAEFGFGQRAGQRLARFELVLLRELGYTPTLTSCAVCGREIQAPGEPGTTVGQQEIVVKAFEPPSGTLPVFSGATIMGDGVPALILDAGGLL